jgi:hypothetical protein
MLPIDCAGSGLIPAGCVGEMNMRDRIESTGKSVGFKVLDDSAVDTTSRTGKLVMGIIALIA